jgi:hypothetical protein
VQAALHERLSPTFAHQANGFRRCVMAVLGLDDRKLRNIERGLFCRRTDLGRRAYQQRLEQPQPGCFHHAFDRCPVAWVGDRGRGRR